MKQIALLLSFVLICSLVSGCSSAQVSTLDEARAGLKTKISYDVKESSVPVVTPPKKVFRKVKYPSEVGRLEAYLTPDPKDGKKKPAIIWITGGDCNSIGDVWTESSVENDQTAAAYRKAGVVMMFPSLRGGNKNPGKHEGFFGEVKDVLSAYDYLKGLPYVDSSKIYLGGHSTGGTLALLVAEVKNPFKAVFAFGPVSGVEQYGDFIPVDFSTYDERERVVRSPGWWLNSVQTPTYVIEGSNEDSSNISCLIEMENCSHSSNVHFFKVDGKDHFSVLDPCNQIIADKIMNNSVSELELK